jgi:hypothetical protein
MADDTPQATGPGTEPRPGPDDAASPAPESNPELGAATDAPATGGEMPDDEVTEPVPAPEAPQAPVAATAPKAPAGSPERGQRRITRQTTTTRTDSETTTHETVVEDIAVVPAVWSAPASEHPRPVG